MSGNLTRFNRASSLALVAFLIVALLLSSCSPSNDPTPPPIEVSEDTTTVPESPPTATITGEELPATTIAQTPVNQPMTEPVAEDPIPAPTTAPLALEPVEDPVPNQVIITFSSTATQSERSAYIETIGGTVGQDIAGLNTVVVNIPEMGVLPESPAVAASEPDYYVSAMQETLFFDDPLYSQQWALPVINAPAGWTNMGADATPVAVAVIDSGICADHIDLAGKILPGYDFVDDDPIPQDDFGHGCGVAGIIAARTGNGAGIAGIAPNARILPLRVLDASGLGTYSDVAAAIVYATDNGAQIINLSLGGINPSQVLENAVNYATGKGVLVIAAAGNTAASMPLYPARYANVVAVGSVDANGQPSLFSNRGVDLWAPGSNIMTTQSNGDYGLMSGTSFAAPQVSGVAALEMARGQTLTINGGIVAVQTPDIVVEDPTPSDPTTRPGLPDIVKLDPVLTDEWAVILVGGTDPNALAGQLGFENLGTIAQLEDTYLFRRAGTEASVQAAAEAASALETSAQITLYEQQVFWPRYSRTPTDPLFAPYQWHLNNTGAFVGTVAGEDTNIVAAWNAGFDGTGVVIAVVDDGLQYTHPDIAPNYNSDGSYDVVDSDTDPAPGNLSTDRHGTAVGGMAAADDDGTVCGVGAAYNAQLSGIRLTSNPYPSFPGETPEDAAALKDSWEATALNYQLNVNDIYNSSWGPFDNGATLDGPGTLLTLALTDGITNGRNGLGNIYIWAGGNGFASFDNANADGYANSRYSIAVASSDWDGTQSSFSDIGSNILVNAPGGPAIATTDLMGTDGYNNGAGWDDDCTDSFAGTSASAPLAAGITALILEANPNLTWRDMQHVLVNSAEQNDSGDSSWLTNAAGHDYSVKYGFGRIDAAAAVTLAQTWQNVVPEITDETSTIVVNTAIPQGLTAWTSDAGTPPGPGAPVTSTVVISEDIQIEHVEIDFAATHDYRGDIIIELESPSGTVSEILSSRRIDNGTSFQWGLPVRPTWTFSSAHFWDELSAGTWTIRVYDGWSYAPLPDEGIFESWRLRIYGTLPCSAVTGIPESECNVLKNFYRSTYGPQWTNSTDWFITKTPCTWFGVTCNGGHVTELDLNGNNLQGTLPDLSGLTNLEMLFLSGNQFTGTVTATSLPTTLTTLDLGINQLSGAFPDLSSLSNLEWLSLRENQFSGGLAGSSLPDGLIDLNLEINQLDGSFPDFSGKTDLEILSLANNAFVGDIPPSFADLTALTTLDVGYNALTVPANPPLIFVNDADPDWASTQTSPVANLSVNPTTATSVDLVWDTHPYTSHGGFFRIGYRRTTDVVWTEVDTTDKTATSWPITALDPNTAYYFRVQTHTPAHDVQQNDLWSEYATVTYYGIPTAEYDALVDLYNDTNGPGWTTSTGWLADDAPCGWYGITCVGSQVTEIALNGNNLAGNLPDLSALTGLTDLDLSSNTFSGSIDPGDLPTSLTSLNLSGSGLGGGLPNLFSYNNLATLDLSNNQLTGSIAGTNLPDSLTDLDLGSNLFTGIIPDLSGLIQLEILALDNNALAGEIPLSLTSLTGVTTLDLGYNALYSTDPVTVIPFLGTRDPDWDSTQTVTPTNLAVIGASPTNVVLGWSPILYTGDGGYYEVDHATSLGGPWTTYTTADKLTSTYTVTGLDTQVPNYFRVRTFTPVHGTQQTPLYSDYTSVLTYEIVWVTINERELFNQMVAEVNGDPTIDGIEFTVVDFVPDELHMTIRTADQVVGDAVLSINMPTDYMVITVDSILVEGEPALDSYVAMITTDLPIIIVRSLDTLLQQKIGAVYTLETINVVDMNLEIAVLR